MYGYIYETTNLVNGKKYIGKKISNKFLGEKYLGSGTYLKRAINKYGKENFRTRLLETCENSFDLDTKECEYIQKYNCVESSDYYNLASGIKGNTSGSRKSLKWRSLMSEMHKGMYHTEETKQKISKIVSNTRWVYNPNTNQQHKVTESEIDVYLSSGYVRGRRPFSDEHKKALSKSKHRD